MNTVQSVFDMAIHLIDAQNESTGSTNTVDTKEYALRTPNLINTILDQVYPYSDTYPDTTDETVGSRPSLPSVTALEDYLDLDDYISRNVLPYGLAQLLLTEENEKLSNFFGQKYEENLNNAKNRLLTDGIQAIEDVYGGNMVGWGGIEYGWFGQW